MQLRHVVSALWLAALACSSDGNAPVGPPPPPPPPAPPPGPTVVTVTHAPGPSQLVVQNNAVYWYDSSNAPFKKLSLTSGASPVVPMAEAPAPDAAISDGAYAYWVSSGRLYRTTLD